MLEPQWGRTKVDLQKKILTEIFDWVTSTVWLHSSPYHFLSLSPWSTLPRPENLLNYSECLDINDVCLVFLMALMLTSQLVLTCSYKKNNNIRRNSSGRCPEVIELSLNKYLSIWSVFIVHGEQAFAQWIVETIIF